MHAAPITRHLETDPAESKKTIPSTSARIHVFLRAQPLANVSLLPRLLATEARPLKRLRAEPVQNRRCAHADGDLKLYAIILLW